MRVKKRTNKSISLLGLSQHTNSKLSATNKNFKKKEVLSIDSECLGWSGAQNIITKAFKFACLSYAPSKIDYEGSLLSREDFISIRRSKLEECRFNSELVKYIKAPQIIDILYNTSSIKDINKATQSIIKSSNEQTKIRHM